DLVDLCVDRAALRHQRADLAVRVDDGGVVAAAELLPDLRQRHVGQLTAQVHGDVPSGDQDPGPARAAQVLDGQPEVGRGLTHDGRRGDLRAAAPLAFRYQVLEHDLGEADVDALAVEAGEGGDPDQRAFQLPDVRGDPAGDVLEHVRRRVQALLDGLLPEDGDPGLKLRRLDVGQQAPLEPAAQPVLQGDEALRGAVTGDDDLLARVVQRVECVEELLLGAFLVLQELDVVHEEDVDVPVASAEPVL